MNKMSDTPSINLGAGLEVVRAFLDFVARSDCGPAFINSPEYVAARCVLDRLHSDGVLA